MRFSSGTHRWQWSRRRELTQDATVRHYERARPVTGTTQSGERIERNDKPDGSESMARDWAFVAGQCNAGSGTAC